jgi:hypothetical protein
MLERQRAYLHPTDGCPKWSPGILDRIEPLKHLLTLAIARATDMPGYGDRRRHLGEVSRLGRWRGEQRFGSRPYGSRLCGG